MNNQVDTDVAVLIGRFQPFHVGHAMLLRLALETSPRVVVVLGSSFHARSPKNPFTWRERAEMIWSTLAEDEKDRVSFVAVRDCYEDSRWAEAVRKVVLQSAGSAKGSIALIGHYKDQSSYYLDRFPQWRLVTTNEALTIDATRIRKILFEAEDIDVSLAAIADLVPTSIRQYLKAWSMLPGYALLSREHEKVEAYKASWKTAPYPPIFSTVDAIVQTAGRVLLIKRADFPGKGLWAIPGGFVEQHERLLHGAIRELREETGLAVLTSSLVDALAGVSVFDHPDRSLRGRTITHAHFFDLKTERLPAIEAADDAIQALWIPIDELASMEEQFFDDHFHILDHFLGLTVVGA